MRSKARLACALVVPLLLAVGAAAEIYRWTDARGRVHFTGDLSQVPAEQRAAAEPAARERARAPSRLQTYASPPSAKPPADPRGRCPRGLEIPFEKRGGAMLVQVRINDQVTAPFLVDTGASDVALPAALAQQAGIRVDADTPQALYQTANGVVRKPVVLLESVEVGPARVENVRGSVSESMEVGLLGSTFFDHFTYQVDPVARTLTLVPHDRLRQGLSEPRWREHFRALRGQLEEVEQLLADASRRAQAEQLEQMREALKARLAQLEAQADRARVPQAWRH